MLTVCYFFSPSELFPGLVFLGFLGRFGLFVAFFAFALRGAFFSPPSSAALGFGFATRFVASLALGCCFLGACSTACASFGVVLFLAGLRLIETSNAILSDGVLEVFLFFNNLFYVAF